MTEAQSCVDEQDRAVVDEEPQDWASLARGWMLMAAEDPEEAHRSWQELGVALVACGRKFGVVRMEAELVWAATGKQRMVEVDRALAEALAGPVFMSLYPHRYYALVPAAAAHRHEWAVQRHRDARYLGEGSVVGVPLVGLTAPDGARPYWCVPLGAPGDVCSADAVSQFVARGREVLGSRGEGA